MMIKINLIGKVLVELFKSAKEMQMKSVANAIILAAVLGLFAGCGPLESSDPARDYPELKGMVTPHNEKPRNQGVDPHLYSLAVVDPSQPDSEDQLTLKDLTFSAGQTKSYDIYIAPLQGFVPDLVVHNGPKSPNEIKLEAIAGRANKWRLTWTAPGGKSAEFLFQIEVVAAAGTVPQLQTTVARQPRIEKGRLTVTQSTQSPTIKTVEGLKNEITEGQNVQFSVVVEDPSSSASHPPQLDLDNSAEANSELAEQNGSAWVVIRAPELNTKSGKWTFPCILNTQTTPVTRPVDNDGEIDASKSAVVLRLPFRVFSSASSAVSATRTERVTVKFRSSVEAPILNFSSPQAVITFETGVQHDITFSALTANPSGNIEFVDMPALVQTVTMWPGKPTIECDDSGRTGLYKSCVFSWRPPCGDASIKNEYSLTVKAKNTVFGKSAEKSLTKTLKIVKSTANCPKSGGQ